MAGRRALDKYYTPAVFVPALYNEIGDQLQNCTIFEPCVGTGVIIDALKKCGVKGRWITNDVDPNVQAVLHYDASKYPMWVKLESSPVIGKPDWVVTNPPFNKAVEILDLAHDYTKKGVVMYLRLSFQEACENRSEFLWNHPPTRQITLPRFSFTGDGNSDSVTGAWFTWEKNSDRQYMKSYDKDRLRELWESFKLGPVPS